MVKVNTTAKPCATVSGSFNANKTVELRDGLFPEFDRHWRIYGKTVTVFDAPNSHDIILGCDFLDELGIVIDFQNHQVRWINKIISIKSKPHWQNHTNGALALDRGYLDILDDDDIANDAFILDAKYKATTGREIASKQVHLTTEQQNLLATALENTQEFFDGNLEHYKHEKIHLEVKKRCRSCPFQSVLCSCKASRCFSQGTLPFGSHQCTQMMRSNRMDFAYIHHS
ncbi:unnamed protein product [Cylindrotheca closterium]|uniref:Uncharacterized protein n=1 Tax=Cylindrotheca closterium TaxID=2856 RepID=A0AAD2CTS6_9STRA|nr:unnamed protein product [Cylindrotheca closterium]